MQFGLLYFSSGEEARQRDKYRLVLEGARFADRHGFAGVWVPERHFTRVGCLFPNPAVVQAALARETSRVRLRAGSVVLPLHHPVRVAEEWSVVDNLSGGRVELSFASGWHPDDFVFAPDDYANRHEAMYRAIEVVQSLWRGGTYKARGGDGKEVEVRIYPTPVQKELTVWLTAAGNPRTFARAGALGAHLLTHLWNQGPDELAARIALYRQARAEAGHDPDAGHVAVMLHTFVGASAEEVRHEVRGPFTDYLKSSADLLQAIAYSQGQALDFKAMSERDQEFLLQYVFDRLLDSRVLFGTPESCLPLIQQLRAAGVDEIACQVDFGVATEVILANLPHLGRLRELCDAGTRESCPDRYPEPLTASLDAVKERCAEELSAADFYAELERRGIGCPANVRVVESIRRTGGEALARVRLAEAKAGKMHPAYLNACCQVLLATVAEKAPADFPGGERGALAPCSDRRAGAVRPLIPHQGADAPRSPVGKPLGSVEGPYLPGGMRRLRVGGQPRPQAWCHAILRTLNAGGSVLEGDVRILDDQGRAVVEIHGLRLQKTATTSQPGWDRYADWFYELAWEPRPLPAPTASGGSAAAWLIFADSQGVGQRLADLLRARGHRCVLATPDEPPEGKSGDLWCTSDGRTEEIETFLARHSGSANPPLRGIVHLWGLDAGGEAAAASLEKAQRLGIDTVPHILRPLAQAGTAPPPRLWLVTSGCQSAGATRPLGVAQAPLWGLGRLLPVEHPQLWGGLVDLDPDAAAAESAGQLLGVVGQADREDQVAFRRGRRYVARLRRLRQPAAARPLTIHADGSYLITGGLGGIGLKLAEWLAHRGARQLVLLGRTPLPPRSDWDRLDRGHPQAAALTTIQDLEAEGVRVHLAAADVADEQAMTAVLADMRAGGLLPLRGVFHAAGIGQDRAVAELDTPTLRNVLRSKVAGSWLLHRLTAGEPLDFFVLFSSVSSILAQPGQGSYAAANAFLDALAHLRARQGLPALCVNWGPWGDVGFGTTPQGVRQHALLALQGITRMSAQQGMETLEILMRQGPAQLGVVPIDWARLLLAHPDALARPLLELLVEGGRGQRPAAAALPGPSRDCVAPRNDLERALVRLWQEILKVDRVGVHDNFFELGGQSIQGAVLVNKLQERLGEVVHIVSLFDAPTVADLAVYLADHYPAGVARLLAERPPSAAAPEAPLDDERLESFRRLVRSFTGQFRSVPAGPRNPPALFILSPPRCGSTLLRVMLAGHSRLFAPPELELLSFPTLADRKAGFAGRNSYRLQGTLRALTEIYGWGPERAARMMEAWEAEGWTSQRFYRLLQEGAAGKTLVDKTPSYGLDRLILERAEAWFAQPLYVHLVRHPYGMILSFEEAHMEALFAQADHGLSPRQLAEANWTVTEDNVRAFLAGIPAQRQCRIRYEDLVARPRQTLETVCRLAGLEFEEGLLRPYHDKERRMTDGIQMFGDVKFHKHRDIDPAAADRWVGRYAEDFLSGRTWELAEAAGYPRPQGAVRSATPPPIGRRTRAAALPNPLRQASDAEVDRLLQSLLPRDNPSP
jgi:natural product biosynthesis luciferase-like monooxygenase protein